MLNPIPHLGLYMVPIEGDGTTYGPYYHHRHPCFIFFIHIFQFSGHGLELLVSLGYSKTKKMKITRQD